MNSPDAKPMPPRTSPLFETFETLGDGWVFLILREAFFGAHKFEEFRSRTRISRSRLTERLATLTDKGIFERHQYEAKPPRYEYRLSPAGHDIYGMTLLMKRWGDRWRGHIPKPKLELIHKSCGAPLVPEYLCQGCQSVVLPDEAEITEPASIVPTRPNFPKLRKVSRKVFSQAARNDSVARTLEVVGDHWTMALLSEAILHGTDTYEGFVVRLGIARQTLSSRLQHLVAEGAITREVYQERPVRYAYRLTESGNDLTDIFCAMFEWGKTWRCGGYERTQGAGAEDDRAGPAGLPSLIHTQCEAEMRGSVVCETCGEAVHSRDVEYAKLE